MITLFYACALTILALVLAYLTGRQRFKTGTNLGLGDSFELLQISRAHANLLENALLILSFLLETVGNIPTLAIGILGDVFLISRIFHAYGITREGASSIFRALGTIGSLIVLITQSIWGFIISISWLANNNWGL